MAGAPDPLNECLFSFSGPLTHGLEIPSMYHLARLRRTITTGAAASLSLGEDVCLNDRALLIAYHGVYFAGSNSAFFFPPSDHILCINSVPTPLESICALYCVEMYDPDIIAYLFPAEGAGRDGAIEAITSSDNESRCLPPRRRDILIKRTTKTGSPFVREATEQPEEVNDLDRLPCLVLKFSDRPKSRLGLVGGREPTADLRMPDIKGVSGTYFTLTFDEQKELIVKDLNSLVGTRVIYDDENPLRGHGIVWSARGPSLTNGKAPVLKVFEELQFRIVVPNHDITSTVYLDNVARFFEGAAAAEDLFSDLKIISRARTELPTPGEAEIPSARKTGRAFWKKKIAQGSFAVVTYVWDVTSREVYALKEPLPGKTGDWKKEANIMKGISHVSVSLDARALGAELVA